PPLDPFNSASLGSGSATTLTKGRCDPDAPGCDLNKCTAMSESARKTLSCMEKAGGDNKLPNYMAQGIGCDPTVCDPAESSAGRGIRGAQCLAAINPNTSEASVSKQCGVVTCAAGESVFRTPAGQCGCGAPSQDAGAGSTFFMGICSEVTDCEWGPAQYKN